MSCVEKKISTVQCLGFSKLRLQTQLVEEKCGFVSIDALP